jgi:hypothetical protein
MVPGHYSLLLVSMIEECISFLCRKEDHTLQYVVSLSLVFCLLFEDQGSMHWEFDITDAVVF